MEQTLRRVLIGNKSDLPERLGKTVTIGTYELAIFKLASGEVRAIENRCPHKGGVLADGMVSGEYVFCPLHDWKISIVDGQVQKPDDGCVPSYKIEVKNDLVYVLLPE
ncbi:nitrite reductase small subunit NirD [Radiobacillus kanasensis]|uniref:nitrite reductase small subunit NirD n=1 Tax=Radiobacillus kanasensis TaxID=2844358 RepID=UPI001E3A31F9|nr:nitrite reductase small subunit NirD [Radiobacillus kanasensis]UFU00669.1 nitrite reductase small subunit NirD [Radiobacillus kanasensis]